MEFTELDRKEEVREALMRVTGLPFDHEGYLLSLSQYEDRPSEGLRLLNKEKEAINAGIKLTMEEMDLISSMNRSNNKKTRTSVMPSVYRQLTLNRDLIEEVSHRLAGVY